MEEFHLVIDSMDSERGVEAIQGFDRFLPGFRH
jgi:hypothetical protein